MRNDCRKPYVKQFYRGNRVLFAVSIVATLLTGSINLVLAWMMQQVTDTVSRIPGSRSIGELTMLLAAVIAAIILFKWITYYAKPKFMQKAMSQYREYAFERLTHKSIASFENESAAAYLSAFSNDANTIETGYLENIFEMVFQLLMLCGSMAMMLTYSPLMTLVATAFFILPVLATLLAGDRLGKAEKQVSDRNAALIASLKDSLSGFSVVKSFKAEDAMQKQFSLSVAEVEEAKKSKRRIATIIAALAGVAGVTAQLGTFLAGGALALNGWNITPGVLFVFIDLTANVINPVNSLPGLLACRKAALGLVDKLAQTLETNAEDAGKTLPPKLEEGIQIKDLSFAYEEGKTVLTHVNCCFEAGKSYAIVGASGSGKSTLLNLLMAAHGSYQGSIAFDGMELRETSSQSLYDLASMIQQQVYIFNASIRDNITMFREFPKDAVDRAIEQAGLTDLIRQKGEAYLCGENGSGLSGGEKQRISIARALLRGASVLLADEATAALDAHTAHQVSNAILNLDILRIVVTHKLEASLLRRFDHILVLKNGSIAECGTFEELMNRKEYFYSLYSIAQ